METFSYCIEIVGTGIDAIGVLVVVVGAFYATARFALKRGKTTDTPYRIFRQDIGRAILLGLEFLVAG